MILEIGKCTSCGQPSGKVFEFCEWCNGAPTQCDEHWASGKDNEFRRRCDQEGARTKFSPRNFQAEVSQIVYHGLYGGTA